MASGNDSPTSLTPEVAGLEGNISKLSWDSPSDSPGSCLPLTAGWGGAGPGSMSPSLLPSYLLPLHMATMAPSPVLRAERSPRSPG